MTILQPAKIIINCQYLTIIYSKTNDETVFLSITSLLYSKAIKNDCFTKNNLKWLLSRISRQKKQSKSVVFDKNNQKWLFISFLFLIFAAENNQPL